MFFCFFLFSVNCQISDLPTTLGMTDDREDTMADSTGGGLDFHYPHPYEVEIRAFHYMPGQASQL